MNEIIKKIKEKELGLANYLYQKIGGEWLGSIRSWMQSHAYNGESVTWGTDEFLKLKLLTVRDVEYLAANIAARTLEEYSSNLVSDNEVKALKIFANPENWTNENGKMIFQPDPDKFHFVHATMNIKNGYELLIDPEQLLKNIRNQ